MGQMMAVRVNQANLKKEFIHLATRLIQPCTVGGFASEIFLSALTHLQTTIAEKFLKLVCSQPLESGARVCKSGLQDGSTVSPLRFLQFSDAAIAEKPETPALL